MADNFLSHPVAPFVGHTGSLVRVNVRGGGLKKLGEAGEFWVDIVRLMLNTYRL